MTVGEVIQALWWQPAWLVLAVLVILAIAALLVGCTAVMLFDAWERHRALPRGPMEHQ